MSGTAETTRPKVSVLLITYNHEKYIAEAIESILAQETEYSYTIHVIEDCSTDKTQEVVMRYVEKYPDKVIPFFNAKNIGYKVTQKNLYRGFQTMNGEYLAILEGDDYWDSPHKLQKQVSFLEANPEYVAAAHNTIKKYEDNSQPPHRFLYSGPIKDDHSIEDMIYIRSFFHTTTLIYRNVFNGVPPKQFKNPWSCDIFNTIAHAQFGKIRYFDDDMAVYRAHSGGRFSGMGMLEGWLFNINGLRRYNEWLGYRYLKTFAGSIVRYCDVVLRGAGRNGVASLTILQALKCMLLRIGYSLIFHILSLPTVTLRFASLLRPKALNRSAATRALSISIALLPAFFLSLVRLILAILITNGYAFVCLVTTQQFKEKVIRFEKQVPLLISLRELITGDSSYSIESLRYVRDVLRNGLGNTQFGDFIRYLKSKRKHNTVASRE